MLLKMWNIFHKRFWIEDYQDEHQMYSPSLFHASNPCNDIFSSFSPELTKRSGSCHCMAHMTCQDEKENGDFLLRKRGDLCYSCRPRKKPANSSTPLSSWARERFSLHLNARVTEVALCGSAFFGKYAIAFRCKEIQRRLSDIPFDMVNLSRNENWSEQWTTWGGPAINFSIPCLRQRFFPRKTLAPLACCQKDRAQYCTR